MSTQMVKPDASPTRGDRTRSAVVAAASARFAAHGFEGTTVASIAADAGVSEPTIAFHFGSKAGLLVAVMQAFYDELLAQLPEVLDPALPPEERLRTFARWWLQHNAERWAPLEVFASQGRRSRADDEVVAAFRACNQRVTREFDRLVEDLRHANLVRDSVPTRMVRDVFFGGAEHVLLGRVLTGRPDDLAAAAEDLTDLILGGAAGPSQPGEGEVAQAISRLEAKVDRLLG